MVNLRELELQGNTKCTCGYEFTTNDVNVLTQNKDYDFYGGRVNYYSEVNCPKCGKEQVLLLEVYNPYKIIDIGCKKVANDTKKSCEKVTAGFLQADIKSDVTVGTTDVLNAKDITEFVCSKCGKACKSNAGLIAHKRVCKG